ncbi:hypothetical protein ACHAXT_005711 [Thalassiosira profunda]
MEGDNARKRRRGGDGAEEEARGGVASRLFAAAGDVARMEEENSRLRTRCADLEGTVHLLKENLAWEYSAAVPDDGYWESQGLQGERAVEQTAFAGYFCTLVRHYTCQMRKGKAPQAPEWRPGASGPGPENYIDLRAGPSLLWDDVFLPHWNELASALKVYHCLVGESDVLLALAISSMQLSKEALDVLGEGLSQFRSIGELIFYRNTNFAQVGNAAFQERPSDILSFALDVAKFSPRLTTITFAQNEIQNNAHLESLCDVVRDHPSLQQVRIPGCCGEGIDGLRILQRLIAAGGNKLREIVFSVNNVSTGGNTFLSDFLANNPPLKRLELGCNKLDENDARLIAASLKSNTNLSYLGLNGNKGASKGGGREALMRAIFDDTSLNTVIDCNHTCQISLFHGYSHLYNGPAIGFGPYEAASNRRRKISYILKMRNKEQSNVRHFESDGVTLKDIPHVLRGVQRNARNRAKRLSVVFEIMRGMIAPEF